MVARTNSGALSSSGIPYHQPGKGASAPLSFGQPQLWFFNQMQPTAPHKLPVAMRPVRKPPDGGSAKSIGRDCGHATKSAHPFRGGSPELSFYIHPHRSALLHDQGACRSRIGGPKCEGGHGGDPSPFAWVRSPDSGPINPRLPSGMGIGAGHDHIVRMSGPGVCLAAARELYELSVQPRTVSGAIADAICHFVASQFERCD